MGPFTRISIVQQRDSIILTLSITILNAIGGVASGIIKRKVKLQNFEKLMRDSYSLLPKVTAEIVNVTAIFPKRSLSLTKTARS